MNILAVDDEEILLAKLTEEIRKVFPEENVIETQSGLAALTQAEGLVEHGKTLDYAFLDVQLRGMTGIDLAKLLKEKCPDVKILFCTGFSQYAADAFKIHALGYILKPVSSGEIIESLDAMNRGWDSRNKKIYARTFGYFDLLVDGKAVSFSREKAKEVLAFLIDQKGVPATTRQITETLWEGEPYGLRTKNAATTAIAALRKTLTDLGIEELLVKGWNRLAIDPQKLVCDRYEFEKGDVEAVNAYRGEYLVDYSWA